MIITDKTVPGVNEAKAVQTRIKQLGIQDVELFYNATAKMWCVCQVRQVNTGILSLDNTTGTKVEPMILWWCKDKEHRYRNPNETDVSDVVAVVQRAQHWFQKGGDVLASSLEDQDQKKREDTDQLIKERIKPHVKSLKRAMREEL